VVICAQCVLNQMPLKPWIPALQKTAFLSKHSIIVHIQELSCCHHTNDVVHSESVLKERNGWGGGGDCYLPTKYFVHSC